jgi:hypothetical protein
MSQMFAAMGRVLKIHSSADSFNTILGKLIQHSP